MALKAQNAFSHRKENTRRQIVLIMRVCCCPTWQGATRREINYGQTRKIGNGIPSHSLECQSGRPLCENYKIIEINSIGFAIIYLFCISKL